MRGYGKNQQKVLTALAKGPLDRATLEARTGMKGNVMDQLVFTMRKANIISRTGQRGSYIYERAEKAPHVVWTQPPKPQEPTPQQEPAPKINVGLSSLDAAIAEVAQSMAAKIAEQIAEAITAALPQAVARAAEKFDVSQFTPKPKGPQHKKVFIAGLRQKDTGFIAAEFATKFDLSFAETDEYSEKTKANARNADHAIIMTDHINHSMVKFIESTGAQPILIAGGQTTLKNKLDSLPA